jgi:hypothetical protein
MAPTLIALLVTVPIIALGTWVYLHYLQLCGESYDSYEAI